MDHHQHIYHLLETLRGEFRRKPWRNLRVFISFWNCKLSYKGEEWLLYSHFKIHQDKTHIGGGISFLQQSQKINSTSNNS